MKKIVLSLALLAGTLFADAQANDPVVMTIGGKPVLRSEYQYSYNKNNSEGVIDKKNVTEYAELFVNYKMKVLAALDAKKDTLSSFKKEYKEYRNQQVLPTLITEADVEAEAHNIYNNTVERIGDTLLQPAHILLLTQGVDSTKVPEIRTRIDSIYNALTKGADFVELCKAYSQDPGSVRNDGIVGWVGKGQLVPEFEQAMFELKDGEISKPVKTAYGYHIIKMLGRKPFESYDSLRNSIYQFIDQRGIRDKIARDRLVAMAQASNGLTIEDIMDQRADSLAAIDEEMKYLFKEYYDGLLLYEIENELVWDKAAKDEAGLNAFFKKNKKKYVWDEPRFKGIAFHCKDEADIEAVKKSITGKKFNEWGEILRSTFNADSTLRIRAEKGIFNKGDNSLIDKEQFNMPDRKPKPVKGFPYDSSFGTILNAPEEMEDVRSQVVTDYQEVLEKKWLKELHKKYKYTINQDILNTVK